MRATEEPEKGQRTVERLYRSRRSRRWQDRLRRWLTPPAPLVANPRELQVNARSADGIYTLAERARRFPVS